MSKKKSKKYQPPVSVNWRIEREAKFGKDGHTIEERWVVTDGDERFTLNSLEDAEKTLQDLHTKEIQTLPRHLIDRQYTGSQYWEYKDAQQKQSILLLEAINYAFCYTFGLSFKPWVFVNLLDDIVKISTFELPMRFKELDIISRELNCKPPSDGERMPYLKGVPHPESFNDVARILLTGESSIDEWRNILTDFYNKVKSTL